MGFPAADFDECAPMVWGHGDAGRRTAVRAALRTRRRAAPQWQLEIAARRATRWRSALALARRPPASRCVIADTQDNPGAGGDSNTTGMLHALLAPAPAGASRAGWRSG